MKIIVKPTKNFMLMLPFQEEMQAGRPSIVSESEYLTSFIMRGEVRVLVAQDVPDSASDKDFANLLAEIKADAKSELKSDEEKESFAIESYLSSLSKSEAAAKKAAEADAKKAAEAEAAAKKAAEADGKK